MDKHLAGAAPPGEPGHDPAPPPRAFHVEQAQIRVFDRSDQPDSDDASDMYVVEVFGVSVLVRLRRPRGGGQPELYVHIDNEPEPRSTERSRSTTAAKPGTGCDPAGHIGRFRHHITDVPMRPGIPISGSL